MRIHLTAFLVLLANWLDRSVFCQSGPTSPKVHECVGVKAVRRTHGQVKMNVQKFTSYSNMK